MVSSYLTPKASESEDEALIQSLYDIMQDNEADFTLTFRGLCDAALSPERGGTLRHLFKDAGAYDKMATNWRVRLSREAKAPDGRVELMHQANPAVIPRNHRIEQAMKLPWIKRITVPSRSSWKFSPLPMRN